MNQSGTWNQINRRGSVVRPIVMLLAVVAVTAGALWWSVQNKTTDLTNGGLLFPVDPAEIEGILLTKQGSQYRFDRLPNGAWSLSGAANDYLDRQAMDALVAVLPTAQGGAILPGTEPEDRRYDFNGPDAIRLRIFLAGGEEMSLALGAINPVTGNYFGSHAGRKECFPVAAPLRDKLFMLPMTVQAKQLLPEFDSSLVAQLDLTRSGREHNFRKFEGRWWLRLTDDDVVTALRGFPPTFAAYQSQYEDRRRRDEQGTWIMASSQAMDQLVYEISDIVVRDIKNPRESALRMEQWELNPAWRQVVLRGEGINADPTAPAKDEFTLAFGTPVSDDRVPVLRRGNVMLTDFDAVNLLNQDLGALIEKMALNDSALKADHLKLEREGVVLLEARRTDEETTADGRTAWRTVVPTAPKTSLSEDDRHGISRDLIVNLNRIEILAVLPPTTDPVILAAKERIRVTLSWGTNAVPRQMVFDIGHLVESQLPAGSGTLARTQGAAGPAAMWFPATGKLLQVPDQLIVTARSLALMLRPASSP